MKPLYIIQKMAAALMIIMMIGTSLSAQANNQKEQVESMRVAFITHRLNLTPDESNQFWPIYTSYRQDLTKLRKNFYPKDDGNDPHLSADRQLEFEQKKLDLKKKYKPEFEQVLGKDKLNQLVSAEEDFKKMLVQIVRNRKQQRATPK